MPPEKILKQIEIDEQAKVADFGSGSGYFSVPLAEIAKQGSIYALDVIADNLEAVKSKAELAGVSNIITRQCDLEKPGGSKIESDSVDLVLMRNILFQSQKKQAVIEEAKRVLKPGGQLVVIEWQPEAVLAPKEGWLLNQAQADQLVDSAGFSLVKKLSLDEHHFGAVYKK